jgi:hypothetical protein
MSYTAQKCTMWQYAQFLGVFAELRKAAASFVCVSVRPHETTLLPGDGFLQNLVFEYVSKICRECASFIKI